MTALTNDALLEILSEDAWPIGDEIFIGAGASTAQAGGVPVKGCCHRVTKNGTANGSLVMKSITSVDAPSMVWIINDDATNAVKVFCAAGDNMNGSANGSLTVGAASAAVFARVPAQIKRKGGSSGGGSLDWRSAVIT